MKEYTEFMEQVIDRLNPELAEEADDNPFQEVWDSERVQQEMSTLLAESMGSEAIDPSLLNRKDRRKLNKKSGRLRKRLTRSF